MEPTRRASRRTVLLTIGIAATAGIVATAPERPAWAEATPSGLFEAVNGSVVRIYSQELIVDGVDSITQRIEPSQGSGVVISEDGRVLTAAHVVQSADRIIIVYPGGKSVQARVWAAEPAADVAILEPLEPPPPQRHARLGRSDRVRIGDRVTMVGHPMDLEITVAVGHVAGRSTRTSTAAKPQGEVGGIEVLRTDAHISEGASGAPIFDDDGRVIGIASAVLREHAQPIGIGFFIGIDTVRRLLIDERSMWTGINGHWLGGWYARVFNLPRAAGLLVERIASDSPAAALKMRAGTGVARIDRHNMRLGGDVLLRVQDIWLSDEDGYEKARAAMARLGPGDTLRVLVLRAGQQRELEVTLEAGIR
ncbi:MAG: trypsin-like peptidase domain-containing protein [Burkholderiaceae bacterium]|nr:trypsin-like peptidase domain-containing protein [Burkholderiaceae bacterium]